MAKDPAFLFYSSDFLTGIQDLTFEERGQYITLLCIHHQKGRLKQKTINIAVPNVTSDVMEKFQKDENGLFFNKRLEEESKKRASHAEKQRQRAIKGWEKRKNKSSVQTDATANATALPLEDENEIENRDINKEETKIIEKYPFEDFWNYYDKKTSDKKKCKKKFDSLPEKEKQQIFITLVNYVKSTPEKQYRKNPETYLNQKAWNHEIIKTNNNGTNNGNSDTRTTAERVADIYPELVRKQPDN